MLLFGDRVLKVMYLTEHYVSPFQFYICKVSEVRDHALYTRASLEVHYI